MPLEFELCPNADTIRVTLLVITCEAYMNGQPAAYTDWAVKSCASGDNMHAITVPKHYHSL